VAYAAAAAIDAAALATEYQGAEIPEAIRKARILAVRGVRRET
jgi:hypothetical protein